MKYSRVPVRSFTRGCGDGFFGKPTLAREEPAPLLRDWSSNLRDAVIEDEGDELSTGLEAFRACGLFRSETFRPAAGSDARRARFEPGRRLGILGAASRVRHAA